MGIHPSRYRKLNCQSVGWVEPESMRNHTREEGLVTFSSHNTGEIEVKPNASSYTILFVKAR